MSHADPVTPRLHARVIDRDQRCMALILDPDAGFCTDMSGRVRSPYDKGNLQLDHIQEGYGRMAKRAPSDMAHLVVVCAGHHLGGWSVAHREVLRDYLASFGYRP